MSRSEGRPAAPVVRRCRVEASVVSRAPESPSVCLDAAECALILDSLGGFRAWLAGTGLTSPGLVVRTGDGAELLAAVDRLGGWWAAHAQLGRAIPIASVEAADRKCIVIALDVLREEIESFGLFVVTFGGSDESGAALELRQISNLIARLEALGRRRSW